MKIIKRNGAEETFRIEKIIVAITKANNAAEEAERLTPLQIDRIAQAVEIRCEEMTAAWSVEEIQDLVEDQIMAHGASRSPSAISPIAIPAPCPPVQHERRPHPVPHRMQQRGG